MDHRDAREQASESMMCFVVANFSDMMLRDMVQRYRKVILPEQSQLEVTRYGQDRTLFDQIVDKLLKHQAEFPLSILQEVRREEEGCLIKEDEEHSGEDVEVLHERLGQVTGWE